MATAVAVKKKPAAKKPTTRKPAAKKKRPAARARRWPWIMFGGALALASEHHAWTIAHALALAHVVAG